MDTEEIIEEMKQKWRFDSEEKNELSTAIYQKGLNATKTNIVLKNEEVSGRRRQTE